MLLNLSFKNFKSYREEQLFSMIADEGLTDHDERICTPGGNKPKILPVAAIFGGNSFGKSNFVEALLFIRSLILEQRQKGAKIQTNPFFLDPKTRSMPTSFDLEILSEGKEYKIFIKLDKDRVIEELVSIKSGKNFERVYHRKEKSFINKRFNSDGKIEIVMKSSRPNTLMISNQVLQEMEELKPLLNWFAETLVVISPTSQFVYLNWPDDLAQRIGEALKLLETGVKAIEMTPVRLRSTSISLKQIDELRTELKRGETAHFRTPLDGFLTVEFEGNEISAKSLTIVKEDHDSNEFSARVNEESDGTRRLLDILPGILTISQPNQDKILIIDGIDISLHAHITYSLVKYYLSSIGKDSRSQLIFTTHDIDLMDDWILRNDEIWITEKGRHGASDLVCLSDFEENKTGMTFQQLYKAHNLGGVPNVSMTSDKQLTAILKGKQRRSAGGHNDHSEAGVKRCLKVNP